MRPLSPNATAILLMIGAIFCFSVMDATAKALAPRIGTIPAVWARYAGQALVVLILVAPRLKTVARTNYPLLQLARSVFLMFGTVFFFFSVANIGLTEATAIMNINPVIITLGAALFLGEKIGRADRRLDDHPSGIGRLLTLCDFAAGRGHRVFFL